MLSATFLQYGEELRLLGWFIKSASRLNTKPDPGLSGVSTRLNNSIVGAVKGNPVFKNRTNRLIETIHPIELGIGKHSPNTISRCHGALTAEARLQTVSHCDQRRRSDANELKSHLPIRSTLRGSLAWRGMGY